MMKNAAFLTLGNLTSALLLLARNILVARLISVEDFGIAATFAITMALIEMMTQLGMDRMIIQNKDGDDPKMQAGLQAFQVLRGVIAGAILYLIATPYAAFLGVPEAVWAYQLIALVPILNSLQHFDIFRRQREMQFFPYVATFVFGALASVLAIWPLAAYFGDYRVMLYAILLQYVLMALVSHITAKRPYRWSFDKQLMVRAFNFGWPLLLNGVLLFVVFNGEKLIVGRERGMSELAFFAMAFSLTLTPTLVLAKSSQSFFLPQLSKQQDNDARFVPLHYTTLQVSLVICVGLAVGIALLGPPIVIALLGEKYLPMLEILIWLGIIQGLRVAKTGAAVVSLAKARTGNAMIANLPRVLALPLAWYLLTQTGDIMSLLWVAAGSEIIGYAVALWLVHAKLDLPLKRMMLPIIFGALTLLAIGIDASLFPPQANLLEHLHGAQVIYLILALIMLATMGDMRRYLIARRG